MYWIMNIQFVICIKLLLKLVICSALLTYSLELNDNVTPCPVLTGHCRKVVATTSLSTKYCENSEGILCPRP